MRHWTLGLTAALLTACATLAGCSREEDTKLTPRPERPETANATTAPAKTVASTATPPAAEQHTGILEAPGVYIEAVVAAKFTAETKIWLVEARQRIQAFEVTNDRHPKDLAEAAGIYPFHQLPGDLVWKYDPNTGEIDIVASPGK